MMIEPWIWLATARSGLVRADQVVSIRSGRNGSTGGGADRQFGVFIKTVTAADNLPETALVFTEDEETADGVLRDVLGVLAEARAAERGGIVQFNPVTLVNIEAATALGRAPSKQGNR